MSEVGDRQRAATVDPELASIPMNISRITTRSGRSYDSGTPTPMVAGGRFATSENNMTGLVHSRPDHIHQHAQHLHCASTEPSTWSWADGKDKVHRPAPISTPFSASTAFSKVFGMLEHFLLGREDDFQPNGGKARFPPGQGPERDMCSQGRPISPGATLRRLHDGQPQLRRPSAELQLAEPQQARLGAVISA